MTAKKPPEVTENKEPKAKPERVPMTGRVAIISNATPNDLIVFCSSKNKVKLAPGQKFPCVVTPWLKKKYEEGKIDMHRQRTNKVHKLYLEFTPPPVDPEDFDPEDEV